MELIPQAVSEAEFREARRGGYNIRDVDEFLDRIAAGVGEMQERIREAYQRAETAENRVIDLQRELEDAQRRAADGAGDAEDTLRRTLVLAQRTADATIKEAKDEAQRLVTEARDEAAKTRASAEVEVRDEMASARQQAEAEVQQLAATREQLAGEIAILEQHLDAQRDRIRTSLGELQRVVDDPAALSLDPAPSLGPLPDLPGEHSAASGPSDPEEAMPADPDALDMAGPPPDGSDPQADRPPLPSREPKRSEAASFDPSEDRGPRQDGGLNDDADDKLSLPIDAPPPPPPPPGLDHLRDVGGIPIEPGSRPSEWGKGVFDTDEDEEPKRFGRRR